MADPNPDMLAAALAAWDAGLCVVKAKADGTKRPDGEWKQYQAERPTREQVAEWFKDGWPAMGCLTGAVSNDLEMLELEGRFVAELGTKAFADAAKEAGLELLLKRLITGMLTVSPSDGRHFLYHVAPGPVDGNTKLARRPATDAELAVSPTDFTKVLIETRGEGGFVMLAPSHGNAHPTKKPWKIGGGGFASIPTITPEERDALFAVARSFDTCPVQAPKPPPAPSGRKVTIVKPKSRPLATSYFDAVKEHLKATTSLRSILETHGWSYEYTDRYGRDMLKRPGKTEDGISASINENERLLCFTSATEFKYYDGGKDRKTGIRLPTTTYDRLGVIAMYEYRGDEKEAARAIAEQTGIMDAYKQAKEAELYVYAGVTNPQPQQETRTVDGVDRDTGEVVGPPDVDDSLWSERPALAHILEAARSRLVSPHAVLGCVLARVAAFTPPNVCLPPIIGGGTAPLSLFIALRGRSGAGKSSPVSCAADLLPETPLGCVGPLPLGSGEGLVDAFMELTEKEDGSGKKKNVKAQTRRGALFILDEGQMLTEIGSRKGSTILPVLRTAWSGGDPGQANASIETRRSLKAGSYTVGIISLWQDDAGAELLEDANGGTPQRFVWLPTNDPGASLDGYTWPGRLHWDIPAKIGEGNNYNHTPLVIDPDILLEIKTARVLTLKGELEEDPLDAHRRLNKLKVAGCLAVLDNRRDITPDDWHLAERILALSDQQRDWVLFESRRKATERVSTEIAKAVLKDSAVEKSATDRALRNAARAVYRAAEAAPDGADKRAITHRIASRDRAIVTVDDAIAEAMRLRWIEGNDAVGYRIGEAKPA